MCARTRKVQIADRYPYDAPVFNLSPCGRGGCSLIFARAIHLIALDIPTAKHAATSWTDIAFAKGSNTRDRKFSLCAFAIIHLIKADIESRVMKTIVIKGDRRYRSDCLVNLAGPDGYWAEAEGTADDIVSVQTGMKQ